MRYGLPIALLMLLSVTAAAGDAPDGETLRLQVKALKSLSAESVLLVALLTQGKVTQTYAEVHLQKLLDQADDLRQELGAPASPNPQLGREHVLHNAEALKANLAAAQSELNATGRIHQARERLQDLSHGLSQED